MPINETKQVQQYYDFYRDQEIAFTKETLHYLRIDPRQIYVKCGGGQWPCIINSTSFQFAKIIVGTGSGAYQLIKKQKDIPVSVRYCFISSDNTPLSFFVNGHVTEIKPFNNSAELMIITITFSQQPSDILILRLGQFIDTNINFARRKDERIIINPEIVRKLGLEKEETLISIQNVPRRCVLRDISFGGVKVMCMGIPKFLENKPASIKLTFLDPPFTVDIPGIIKNASDIEGRKDIVTMSLVFDEAHVPMVFKNQINDFLVNNQKMLLELNRANEEQQQQRKAAYEAEQQKQAAQAQANQTVQKPQTSPQTQQPKPVAQTNPVQGQQMQQTGMQQPVQQMRQGVVQGQPMRQGMQTIPVQGNQMQQQMQRPVQQMGQAVSQGQPMYQGMQGNPAAMQARQQATQQMQQSMQMAQQMQGQQLMQNGMQRPVQQMGQGMVQGQPMRQGMQGNPAAMQARQQAAQQMQRPVQQMGQAVPQGQPMRQGMQGNPAAMQARPQATQQMQRPISQMQTAQQGRPVQPQAVSRPIQPQQVTQGQPMQPRPAGQTQPQQ